jgi:SAM-dependent methyltransferase
MDSGADPACRSCGAQALRLVVDLGSVPTGNLFPPTAALAAATPASSLRAWICTRCLLLQLDDAGPDEADDEPGAPGFRSAAIERHQTSLAERVLHRVASLREGRTSTAPRILEVASHGGYVQAAFEARGVGTLIAEPLPDRADAARRDGRTAIASAVGRAESLALLEAAGGPFDAVVDAFLLAHVREPVLFLEGVHQVLAPDGLVVLELAHVGPMIAKTQFDSFRHGHFGYFSLHALEGAARRADLEIVEVEPLPFFGGSLRVWLRPRTVATRDIHPSVDAWRNDERRAGLDNPETFTTVAAAIERARRQLREHLQAARDAGRLVVGYGAPSRATTLLTAAGISTDLLPFTVDRSPAKQGRFLPGSAIPILPVEAIVHARPAELLILTWDIADEVVDQLPDMQSWGGRFVVPLPSPTVIA